MKKDRKIWLWLSGAFMALILFLAFVPVSFAQNSGKNSQYGMIFDEMMRFIKSYYVEDVDEQTLFEGAMKGMFEAIGDPYSVFMTEKEMDALSDTTTGQFGGVGLYISKHYGDTSFDQEHLPYVRVVAPIEDTPAYRLGIHAGDYIIKVGDKSTETMALDEVTEMLRGEPGTKVTVTFLRGDNITFTYEIERAIIEVPSVKSDIIDKNIGYLRIIQFTPTTTDKVKEALENFSKKRIKSLVIDLRSNPGGVLDAAVDIADMFLDDGVIVSTKGKVASPSLNHVYRASKKTKLSKSIPIAVLIDKGSASASEILAAALSDNGRAVLIGETTYGKGSVQQVRALGKDGFKLTMSKYYTPKDVNINKVGIPPAKEVKDRELTEDEKTSYKKLIEDYRIQKFVKENPKPSDLQIDTFIQQLKSEGIVLEDRIIRKLIRNELNLSLDNPPVYDLEFDIVLQEAVRMLKAGEISVK
ncbi:MAG: S41 family peptidase [Spirochaetia bacterium]|nr:S41 family peptidase [Spirochaetia bacterium]